jgi:hypothetical protein
MHRMCLLLVIFLTALATLATPPRSFAQALYFSDADPATMILGNSFYEISLRRDNGALTYITDKATGQHISEGSRYGCLWGSFGSTAGYLGGCSYNAASASRFSYSWSAASGTLLLSYTGNPANASSATALVTIVASSERWFDMRMQLQSALSGTLDYVLFPSDLAFREADLNQVLLPVLPGITLAPSFFAQNRSYVATYPGELFADLTAISASSGNLAIYALRDQAPISPLYLGFNHDDAFLSDSTDYYHAYGARLIAGRTWTSPTIRMRIGQDPQAALLAIRSDNQLDQIRTLPEKLGTRYTQIVQSPLYKADLGQLAMPFSQYATLIARLPAPGILHVLAFQQRGFDENHPDILPPAPEWGSTADMAAMFDQAHQHGLLVMPYTNPTWWDDESPTLRNLPAPTTINDLAVFDRPGVPRYDVYATHGGYVVSAYAPFVQQRLAQMVAEMKTSLPSDMLFEDQIGARSWMFDQGASSPYPTSYPQGWIEHTRTYSPTLLMTEGGNDRLAETEVGFHGSTMLTEQRGQASASWGAGNWQAFPIAPLMLRDKVLFYQHDLAPETFTTNKTTLMWNLAFGYMLSYDAGRTNFGGGPSDPWINVVADMQQQVIARYASQRMLGYTNIQSDVTQSSFESVTVTANWNANTPYSIGNMTIAPQGAMVASQDGSLTAGIFTRYNGIPLINGEHYLIEQRGPNEIIVRQPLGNTTNLSINLLPTWQPSDPLVVLAYDRAGNVIGGASGTIDNQRISFNYRTQFGETAVAYYRIAPGYRSVMPVITRE